MKTNSELPSILFYTSATKNYLPFLPLYVYFANLHNKNIAFEFIVDNASEVERKYSKSLSFLRDDLDIRISLQEINEKSNAVKLQNTLRFVTEPQTRSEFVYIGDVDIIILEDVMKEHRKVFDAGLPYSNIIREGTKRLSGLHFTKYDAYYPIPDVSDLTSVPHNDEEVLYQIVARKGLLEQQKDIDATRVGRPQHGIHMSLNRLPISQAKTKLPWGMNWINIERLYATFKNPSFNDFMRTLPGESLGYFANAYFISIGAVESGETIFTNFTTSKSVTNGPQVIFTKIFETNAWRGAESVSGPSSNLPRTKNLRECLPGIIKKYEISSIVDVPCGDFFWMKEVIPNIDIQYTGGDIVEELVKKNEIKYASEKVSFKQVNLLEDNVPSGDIILCRDLLFHLSYNDIATVLRNFMQSDARYVMTTSHLNKAGFKNSDIKTGGWRWMDLFIEPFCLPETYVEAVIDGGGDRLMCLWEKTALLDAVKRLGV